MNDEQRPTITKGDAILALLQEMPDKEREDFICYTLPDHYCVYCGDKAPCYCMWND